MENILIENGALSREVTLVEKKMQYQDNYFSYPRVSGMENTKLQEKVNNIILDAVNKSISCNGGLDRERMHGDYEVKLNRDGLVCIVFTNRVDGGAHDLWSVDAITIDIDKGSLCGLPDLFIENAGFKNKINEFIKKQIAKRNIPVINQFDSISDEQKFYLTNKAVVFFFDLYQYTPFSFGIPEFIMPYSELYEEINPAGPLSVITITDQFKKG